ncbi:MAG: hypothetical protein Q9M20_06095 [Mariprofundaceae bacterium]|nr:hypothetical protein [Mariprofundaceae bacterium]
MNDEKEQQSLDRKHNIRRRLLTAAVYTPPAILGTMMAGPRHALGAWGDVKQCKMNPVGGVPTPPVILTISSGASACCPCISGSTKYDPVKCTKLQCIKSCGVDIAACNAAGGIGNIKCKDFCKEGPPGCQPPAGCKIKGKNRNKTCTCTNGKWNCV